MGNPHLPSRRSLLKGAGAGLAAVAAGIAIPEGMAAASPKTAGSKTASPKTASPKSVSYTIPSGGIPHTRTFLAWPNNGSFWNIGGGITLAGAQANVVTLARTIAQFEPVVMIAPPSQQAAAQKAVGSSATVIPVSNNDIWIRDMGPTFVLGSDNSLAGVDTNFNGWGNKQRPHNLDALVATGICNYYGIPRIDAPLVTEGGALEPDGQGTLMATQSSIVNNNRNPGKSQATITSELESSFGLSEVVWLQGIKNQDITDDHIDALARFTDTPGIVLVDLPASNAQPWYGVTQQALRALSAATDAQGRQLQAVTVPEPDYTQIRFQGKQDTFLGSYVNFYVCNGAVITPQFGDANADGNGKEILQEYFPDREVVMVNYDIVSANGGGVHCTTQQQPATGSSVS